MAELLIERVEDKAEEQGKRMTEYTVNKVPSYFSILHFSVKDRSKRKMEDRKM